MFDSQTGAVLFKRRMESVRILIQYVVADIQEGRSINNVGWRVVDIEQGIIHFLTQLNAIQNRGERIRLNITDRRLGDKFPSLKRDFEKLKYFLQNREIINEDSQKFRLLDNKIDELIQLFKNEEEIIADMISIGVWQMFSFSGISAPMNVIINNGFSPKNWVISSYNAIRYLSDDIIEEKIANVRLNNALNNMLEIEVIERLPNLPELEEDIIERIKEVIQWNYIKEHITSIILKHLGLTWFVIFISDELNLRPSYTDGSTRLSSIIDKFLNGIIESDLNFHEELFKIRIFFNRNEVEWASEMFSLPEVV